MNKVKNTEQKKKWNKTYYEKHKEEIKKKRREKYLKECLKKYGGNSNE